MLLTFYKLERIADHPRYVVQWLSELGKKAQLASLLEYADNNLNPTWEDGGLYYPRHDVPSDEDLNWTHLSPFCGNASIGYARLNVEDGQKQMWDAPWTRQTLATRPWVDGVGFGDGVDFLRGMWDQEKQWLVLTMRTWDGTERSVKLVIKNLPAGQWTVHVGGKAVKSVDVAQGGEISLDVKVDGHEIDVVVMRKEKASTNGHA